MAEDAMTLTTAEAAKRIQVAVGALAQRGLYAEALRLVQWFQGRPCVVEASRKRASTVTLDDWTELVLIHLEAMVGATPPMRADQIRQEISMLYRAIGLSLSR